MAVVEKHPASALEEIAAHCGRSRGSQEGGERRKVCTHRHLSLNRPQVVEGIQAGSRMCAESCKKVQLLKGF